MSRLFVGALSASLLLALPAHAHGVVGARFFPATVATEDPFAADELALPTITLGQDGEAYEAEWSKTVVKGFSLSVGAGYENAAHGGPSGFSNFEITPTWQFLTDPDGEFVASAAFGIEIGGSGASTVAEPFSTYTPRLLFGKGFGGLPDSMALLRPLAITGVVGYAIPGDGAEPNTVEWGGAIEYSLRYLQTNVRDQGFSQFVAQLTPVVEFDFRSPDNAGTTGTINPGLIWSGQQVQLAAEAVIPVNSASGNTVGAMLQLHFYMDDIFPHSLGTPIFGGNH
ncbi:MAG: hypothetical protein JO348_02535 [Alphaproteobacteria bacterium]|nr:hypothetical protein [Alphaproteobacteria bacterium]MBV9418628.1 hypothetical protein [Alphaproteobacteria bacterium]MBV9541865.1 hypothetical protein [Alphaproteobacteria bacterium]